MDSGLMKKYAREKGAERRPLRYTAERYNERKIGHGAYFHSLPHPVIPVVCWAGIHGAFYGLAMLPDGR